MKKYKVIFHIDEIDKWNMVLNNVSNLLNSTEGNNIKIEVLANGGAVTYYDKNKDVSSNLSKKMIKINKLGVKFVACNNSLIGNNIKKDNLLEVVDIVPTGVLELIEKQNEGYAYIKP